MKILTFLRKNSGVTYHRLEEPLNLIKNKGVDVQIIANPEDLTDEAVQGVTHIIASRFFPAKNLMEFVNDAKSKGIKLILDNDDHWVIPKTNPAHVKYEAGIRKMVEMSMAVADEVWVTTKRLGDEVPNRNVKIVPNAINPNQDQWKGHEYPSHNLTFGYLGGSSHLQDLKYSKINLKGLEGYVTGIKGFKEQINARYELKHLPTNQYGNHYREFDVSLIPLEPTSFNYCKSNLKLIEAGYAKKCAIVQNIPPYSSLIRPNKNCIAIGKGMDWNKAIKNLEADKAYDLACQLHEDVKKLYDLNKVNLIRETLLGI